MTSAGRVLLDECVPRRLLRHLTDQDASHATDEGWAGRRNGALLQAMREASFTVLVTVDRNLSIQQDIGRAGVAVVVMDAASNRTEDLLPLLPELLTVLGRIQPGEVRHIGA